MSIASIEKIPVELPFRAPYVTSQGVLEGREMVIYRIRTQEGMIGLGEAVPMTLRGGHDRDQVLRDLGRCEDLVLAADLERLGSGHRNDIRAAIWEIVCRCLDRRIAPPALAAIDIALHDLAGHLNQVPVWRLLGAGRCDPVSCNATLGADDPALLTERCVEAVRRGFVTFKLKVGTANDIARLGAVRDAVGRGARIRLDANGAWTLTEAEDNLREMQRYGIQLIEQPVQTLEEMAQLRARMPVPIAADESVNSADDARDAFDLGACDAATIKLSKVGGINRAFELAAALPVYLSSALDGPIGIAAAAHTAQLLPTNGFAGELAHGLATLELFAADYASTGPRLEKDGLVLAESPGIGVVIDDDALEALRIG